MRFLTIVAVVALAVCPTLSHADDEAIVRELRRLREQQASQAFRDSLDRDIEADRLRQEIRRAEHQRRIDAIVFGGRY